MSSPIQFDGIVGTLLPQQHELPTSDEKYTPIGWVFTPTNFEGFHTFPHSVLKSTFPCMISCHQDHGPGHFPGSRTMKTALHVFILIFCLLASPSGTMAGESSFAPDTLYAVAIGSATPPIDPNGDPVTNGDFTITRSGGNDIVGDGVDDRTEWRLSYTSTDYDTTDRVVSALLTVMIEPKDPSANNDNIEIDDCDCTDIDVGAHPLHQIYTAEFEMLDYGYESRLFMTAFG